MKRFSWLILCAAVLLPLGFWLSQHVTVVKERVDIGASPEVRSNPYLAMEYFLKEQKVTVQRLANLQSIQPMADNVHTLILLQDANHLNAQQHTALLAWVAKGGHLIVSAQHNTVNQQQDSLLSHFGIQKQLSTELENTQAQVSKADDHNVSTKNKPSPALTRLYLENELSPAYLSFDTRYHLFDTDNRAHAWANSHIATHLLQLSHGHGLVTVLSDFKLWRNQHISHYDHAWLLWYLTQDSQVLLYNPPAQQGLLALIWQHFALACVLLISLLLLAAWSAAPRFAPIQATEQRSRRRLNEHLQASALFNLRYNGQRSLLTALQQDIQQRAQQRYPGFMQLGVTKQWQILQQLSRQPISTISQCMRPAAHHKLSMQAFTLQVQRLQELRNAL